ncbi:MAG: ribonuclease HII [Negativicutes bacterium]|nr:ribonuclease HII [Negativicutes bacterium]
MKQVKMTIAQVAAALEHEDVSPELLRELEQDSRLKVARLLQKRLLLERKIEQERDRVQNLYQYERELYQRGFTHIAGIDEAGRGPLAGPVVVGCVVLPLGCHIPLLNDSKRLTPHQREYIYELIREKALAYTSINVPVPVIDEKNIYQATRSGMYQAVSALPWQPDAVLIDAVPLPELTMYSQPLVGGDALSASIAAASIIAKVERDRIMNELDAEFPAYGFKKHKGYATPEHLEAIRKYGPCPAHRQSFEPVKSWRNAHAD